MRKRRPFLDVIVTDVSARANHLANLFCAKSQKKYSDIDTKRAELENLIDDIHLLVYEYDYGLDARKAVANSLQICWNNLPPEKRVANLTQLAIIKVAIEVGACLKRELNA